MTKIAVTQVPIFDHIAQRWSPRAFATTPVPPDVLISLLEAARWAASSRNWQPWHFVVATHDEPEEYARLIACLNTGNQRWAQRAPLLMLVVTETERPDGSHNRQAQHDAGLAVGNLTLQAIASGLRLRQMGGIDRDKARTTYQIPERFEVLSALAIGYPADPDSLPDDLQDRERQPRVRKPLAEFVFSGIWGQTAPWIED
jgi:nitroreductase